VVRRRLLALALCTASGIACVDDSNLPPRPSVESGDVDAGPGIDGPPTSEVGLVDAGVDGLPVVLASASACGNIHLVLSSDTLFWTETATGMVKSVPVSGGATTLIASNQMRPGAIAADDNFVFWTANDMAVVKRRARTGGPEVVFVPASELPVVYGGENDMNALFISNNTLFLGRFTFVYRIPTDGVTLQIIASSPMSDMGIPGAFAIDTELRHLYQVEIGHNAVSRELLDGSQVGMLKNMGGTEALAPDRIAVSQSELLTDTVGFDDDDVFWANGSDLWRALGDSLESRGNIQVASSANSNTITGFTVSVDHYHIYFGEAETNAVEVASIFSGMTEVLATGQMNPAQFAEDAENIYWCTSDCNIMKLAK
jgi:hypothetical protein